MTTVLDAWNRDLGGSQGRIVPATVDPIAGSYVFCLGFDEPLREEDLAPGDFAQLEQANDITPGAKLLRVTSIIRPPSTVPAGQFWAVQLLLNDVVKVQYELIPGGRTRTRQFAINVSKLSHIVYNLTMRLVLLTNDSTQYITSASYDMGIGMSTVIPVGIATAEAFGSMRIAHVTFVRPNGIASAFASGTAKLTLFAKLTGIATGYASGAHILTQHELLVASGIAAGYSSGTAKLNMNVEGLTGIVPAYASGAASIRKWDPTLDIPNLNHYFRTDFSASPWAGTASIGSSGSFNMSEATHPPTVGTAINSRNPAKFVAGSTQLLTGNDTLSQAIGSSSTQTCWGWVIANVAAATTDPATNAGRATLPSFFTDVNEVLNIGFSTGGFSVAVLNSSAVYSSNIVAAATGSLHLFVWNIADSNDISVALLDAGIVGSNSSFLGQHISTSRAGATVMGRRGSTASNFLSATVAEVGVVSGSLTAINIGSRLYNSLRGYCNDRYGTTFTP